MKISFTYLNHYIEIKLPNDPNEDNTICVNLWRAKGSFDENLYSAYLSDYQFSAYSVDPNQWLNEAISSVINELANWGIRYYEPPPAPPTQAPIYDDIPF